MSTPTADIAQVTHEMFSHLSEMEWQALLRMASQEPNPRAMFDDLFLATPEEQRSRIAAYMQQELSVAQHELHNAQAGLETAHQELGAAQHELVGVQEELSAARQEMAALKEQLFIAITRIATLEGRVDEQQAEATPPPEARSNRPQSLKVDVAKYKGTDSESLPRWLVELDAAIKARNILGDEMKVTYAMSCLAGRAKTWAFGVRMADSTSFLTYKSFKEDLRKAFEPPKSEFRARAEFLDMKQGKRDIPTYAQYARYLVSCVTESPIDDSTQVVAFMKGLVDGPIKTHLFRAVPENLEAAIATAMQEDFGLQQAYAHSAAYRAPRARQGFEADGTEPMDLSLVSTGGRPPFDKKRIECNRCHKTGHYAYECMAARPCTKKGQPRLPPKGWRQKRGNGGPRGPQGQQAKNGKSQ